MQMVANSRARAVPNSSTSAIHSRRPDSSRYPSPAEQTARGMVGPVLSELRRHPEVVGLVVGSFQGASLRLR